MANEATFEQEVRAAVAPVLAEIHEAKAAVEEIHRDLMSKRERDTDADAQVVKDLELRKIEAEAEVQALNERVRKLELEANPAKQERVTKANDMFRGFFLKDADELRRIGRDHGPQALSRALTSGTTLSSAGAMNADQEDQFLDWLVEQQVALSRVNVRRMVANAAYLDELVTGTRKLVAATEATAPSVSDAFSVSRRSLATVETIWAEDLSYSFIEDNIERGNIESHIARNLALAFGNDHNDLFWNGDDDDSGAFLGINNGIIDLAKADASVTDYDGTSVTAWSTVFNGMLKLLDFKYQARPDLAFFIPFSGTFVYADELADRATALGDNVLVNGQQALRYFGIPVYGEPHLTADEAVLSPLANLVWGVQRGITFESERNTRKRVMEYTITARTDHQYSRSEAVVLADSLDSTLHP
jgi:HK97 family phage major capsid protein